MKEFAAAASLLATRSAGRPSFDPVFWPLEAARQGGSGPSASSNSAAAVQATASAAAAIHAPASAAAAVHAPASQARATHSEACIAVDGSHAVLADTGPVWVIAHRAAAVAWPAPRPVEPAPVLTAVLASEAQETLDAAYAAVGTPSPRVRNADALGDALCSLAEAGAARSAIRTAPPGTLVLWDGALLGLPQHAQALADLLRAEAAQHDVTLVGVAKRSALADGVPPTPLVPWLQRHGPAGAWAVAVPDQAGVHVARLHARASHAFRVDARSLGDIGRLVPLCRDAVYAGYPYPLARVHNLVAFTGGRVAELKGRLEAALRHAGPEALALTQDFHSVLDRSVPG